MPAYRPDAVDLFLTFREIWQILVVFQTTS